VRQTIRTTIGPRHINTLQDMRSDILTNGSRRARTAPKVMSWFKWKSTRLLIPSYFRFDPHNCSFAPQPTNNIMIDNPSNLEFGPHHCSQGSLVIFGLPPEILLHILRCHFQSRDFAMDASKRPPNQYAPIHACSTFRQLALEDRQCWATIAITIDLPGMFPSIPRLAGNP
jgi:hypothetical protein